MPAGRPTKYRPEMCDTVIEVMSQGMSKEVAAAEIGVTRETLYQWAKEKPEFSDAIKFGEGECLKFWEELGARGASGLVEGFNASAWIFNMKNRAHWRDKMEHTGEGGGPIRTESKVLNFVGVDTEHKDSE